MAVDIVVEAEIVGRKLPAMILHILALDHNLL